MTEASLGPAGKARWALRGVLDFGSVPVVWPQFEQLLRGGGDLTVSLAGVEWTNSAGLVMLLEARDLARRCRCSLHLVDVPPELLDLARMSRCEELIEQDAD
jgi:phospholipid transport system transporter-binding protein